MPKKIKWLYSGDNQTSRTLSELIGYHSKKIENTHAAGSIRNFAVTEGYIKKYLLRDKKNNRRVPKALGLQIPVRF